MDFAQIIENSLKAGLRPETIFFALAAIGLNIHFGYTGLLNFGQAGFMAVGAYGLAIPVFAFNQSLWVGVICGMLGAVGFALLLGAPTLRLRTDYLGIVTIAAAEIIRITFRATGLREYTGGSNGINGFSNGANPDVDGGFFGANPYNGSVGAKWWIFDFVYSAREAWVMTVGWGLVLFATGITFFLMRSPWGRVLKAVREDEDVASALGKNVFAYKMQSLIIGGLFGAAAGMILALSQGSVQPSPTNLGPVQTFFAYTALIIGGTARLWGPVVGSFIFVILLSFTDNFMRSAQSAGYIPEDIISSNQIGIIRFVILGLGLMLLMTFRPQGIFGDRKEMALDV